MNLVTQQDRPDKQAEGSGWHPVSPQGYVSHNNAQSTTGDPTAMNLWK